MLSILRREHLEEDTVSGQQIGSLPKTVSFLENLELDGITVQSTQHILNVVVAKDQLAHPQLMLNCLNLHVLQSLSALFDSFEGLLTSFFGTALLLDDVVVAFADIALEFGVDGAPLGTWNLTDVLVAHGGSALELVVEVEDGIGHGEPVLEELQLRQLPLTVVNQHLVCLHTYDETLQVHELVSNHCSELLEAHR